MGNLSVQSRLIYAILWTRMNGDNIAWPGQKYLAENVGIGVRMVQRYLGELKEAGLIEVERQGRRRTNRYFLMVHKKERGVIHDASQGVIHDASYSKRPEVRDQITYATTEKSVVADSALKPDKKAGKEPDAPMDVPDFVAWCSGSPQRMIRIIGEWADTIRPPLETKKQWQTFIRRHLRAAKQLEPFTDPQIERAYGRILDARDEKRGFLMEPTLETVIKYLTK